jgi:hypothetical protein
MRSEAVDQFVNSLKKRIKEEKLKQSVERTFLEEAVNLLVSVFSSVTGSFVKGVKNYKSKDFSSYIDVESTDERKLKTIVKESIRSIDSKMKWLDLGDLVIISCNLKSLELISGSLENPILIEVYPSPTEKTTRIRVMLGNRDKHCGKVLRKSMKWVTWIWDGKLHKIVLDRVDPFAPEIIFSGEIDGQTYGISTELDYSGLNYEILSVNKL